MAALTANTMTYTGEVVPGVTCPAIRTDAGETIALSHLPHEFGIGDRVTVTGSGFIGSMTCQQEVFNVETATGA
ncbi:DUF5818 domain-containing protein [Thalassorhabdomicrobium marinisediminis]|uniref:DUF5818 domain-containing protein n=1 Tax=Thalassorhabdomicrobium marinisediminis TaxID=2170577 RepID=UPI00249009AB|nr:DUF5818 domain-containing protein [Thalassorhabdomicrobium marinisediminis]